jgi:hypothetical protein
MFAYPPTYQRLPVRQQIEILRKYFPHLASVNTSSIGGSLPTGAEGWFAVPNWRRFGLTYSEAVQALLGALGRAEGIKFLSMLGSAISPDDLQRLVKPAKAIGKIIEAQKSDFIVLPAQFGQRHAARSITGARNAMRTDEFGLGLFEVGAMLITHPSRLPIGSLPLDCAGDMAVPPGSGRKQWTHAPSYHNTQGWTYLDRALATDPTRVGGSVSGFLLPSQLA